MEVDCCGGFSMYSSGVGKALVCCFPLLDAIDNPD